MRKDWAIGVIVASIATTATAGHRSSAESIFGEWQRVPALSLSLPGDPGGGPELYLNLQARADTGVHYSVSGRGGDRSTWRVTVDGKFDGHHYPRHGEGVQGWMVLTQPSIRTFHDRWFDVGSHRGSETCSLAEAGKKLVCMGYEISLAGKRFPYRDVYVRLN